MKTVDDLYKEWYRKQHFDDEENMTDEEYEEYTKKCDDYYDYLQGKFEEECDRRVSRDHKEEEDE